MIKTVIGNLVDVASYWVSVRGRFSTPLLRIGVMRPRTTLTSHISSKSFIKLDWSLMPLNLIVLRKVWVTDSWIVVCKALYWIASYFLSTSYQFTIIIMSGHFWISLLSSLQTRSTHFDHLTFNMTCLHLKYAEYIFITKISINMESIEIMWNTINMNQWDKIK